MVETSCPAGVLVDFLKRDDVGIEANNQGSETAQVCLHGATGLQPLNGAQAATVGDIKSHET